MKIVLRSDVIGVGRKGDVRDVADGHARNHLLPRGLAIKATPGVEAQAESMRRARSLRAATEVADAKVVAERIVGAKLRIKARVGKDGKLFGSIGASDIATALKQQLGVEIDRRQVKLAEPLKTAGSHTVPILVHSDVTANAAIEISA